MNIKICYNTKEIGTAPNVKEMWSFIHNWLIEDGYTRCWIDPDDATRLVIDYGNWSNFFNCYKEDGWEGHCGISI